MQTKLVVYEYILYETVVCSSVSEAFSYITHIVFDPLEVISSTVSAADGILCLDCEYISVYPSVDVFPIKAKRENDYKLNISTSTLVTYSI